MLLETQVRLEQRHSRQEFGLQAFQKLIEHVIVIQKAGPLKVGPVPGRTIDSLDLLKQPDHLVLCLAPYVRQCRAGQYVLDVKYILHSLV